GGRTVSSRRSLRAADFWRANPDHSLADPAPVVVGPAGYWGQIGARRGGPVPFPGPGLMGSGAEMACPQGLLQPEAWPGRVEPAPMGPCLLQVGKSGGEAEAPQCGEGPDQLLNPGPVRLEAKVRDASSPHKSPGHVQDHEP